MDLQLFLAVNVMSLSLLAVVLLMVYRPAGAGSWLVVHAAILLLGAALLYTNPRLAGVVLAAAFVPLAVVPGLLSYLAMRRLGGGRVQDAARLIFWATLFHPSPHMRFLAATLQAQTGSTTEDKSAALRALAERATPRQRTTLRMLDLRIREDWDGIITLARTELAGVDTATMRDLKTLEIRALGETDRPGQAIEAFAAARTRLSGSNLHTALLFVMAFNGRRQAVETLLAGPLAALDAEARSYWRAIAARNHAVQDTTWRDTLIELAETATSASVRRAAERQLALAPPAGRFHTLTRHEQEALAAAEDWLARQPLHPAARTSRMTATLVLIALNLAAFAAQELWGGSTNLRTGVQLGGMWPPLVIGQGEWWRLASALFLHFGPLHLGVNMLLLFLLGRDSETRSGPARMLTVYLLGGIASSGCVLALMWAGYSPPAVLMGASGAVFALFGYEVARRLVGWSRFGEALDGRGLIVIALVLVIQFAIDLNLPQVSLAAHASGFVAGLVIGGLIDLFAPRRVG